MNLNKVVTANDSEGLKLLINDKFCGLMAENVSYKGTENLDKNSFSSYESSYKDYTNEEKLDFGNNFMECEEERMEIKEREDNFSDQSIADECPAYGKSLFASQCKLKQSSPQQSVIDFVKDEVSKKSYETNMSNQVQEEEKSPILSIFFDNKPIKYAPHRIRSPAIEIKTTVLERNSGSLNPLKRRCTDVKNSVQGKKLHFENSFPDCSKERKDNREKLDKFYDQVTSGVRDESPECSKSLFATKRSFNNSHQGTFNFGKEIEKKNHEINTNYKEEEKSPILSVFFDDKPTKYVAHDTKAQYQVPSPDIEEESALLEKDGGFNPLKRRCTDVKKKVHGGKRNLESDFLDCGKEDKESRERLDELNDQSTPRVRSKSHECSKSLFATQQSFVESSPHQSIFDFVKEEIEKDICEMDVSYQEEKSPILSIFFDDKPNSVRVQDQVSSPSTKEQNFYQASSIMSVNKSVNVATNIQSKIGDNKECLHEEKTQSALSGNKTFNLLKHQYADVKKNANRNKFMFINNLSECNDENKEIRERVNEFCEQSASSNMQKLHANAKCLFPTEGVSYLKKTRPQQSTQHEEISCDERYKVGESYEMKGLRFSAPEISEEKSCTQCTFYSDKIEKYVADDANVEYHLQSSALKEDNFLQDIPMIGVNGYVTKRSDTEPNICINKELLSEEQNQSTLNKRNVDYTGCNPLKQCTDIKDNVNEEKLRFYENFLECGYENKDIRGLKEGFDQGTLSYAENYHAAIKSLFTAEETFNLTENNRHQSMPNEKAFGGKNKVNMSHQVKEPDVYLPENSEEKNCCRSAFFNEEVEKYVEDHRSKEYQVQSPATKQNKIYQTEIYVADDTTMEYQVQSPATKQNNVYQINPTMSIVAEEISNSNIEPKMCSGEEFRSKEQTLTALSKRDLYNRSFTPLPWCVDAKGNEHEKIIRFDDNFQECFENESNVTSMQYAKETEIIDTLNLLCIQCTRDNTNTPCLELCGNSTHFAGETFVERNISNTSNNSESCTQLKKENNDNHHATNFVASKIHESPEKLSTFTENLRNFSEHEKNTSLKTLKNEAMNIDTVYSSTRVGLTEQIKEKAKSNDSKEQLLAHNESNVDFKRNDGSDDIKKRNLNVSFFNDEISDHDSKKRHSVNNLFNFCKLSPTEFLKKTRKRRRKPFIKKKSKTLIPEVPDLSPVIEEFIKDNTQEQGFTIDDLIEFIEERHPLVSHFSAIHASRNTLLKHTKTGALKFQNGRYIVNKYDSLAQSISEASGSTERHAPSTSRIENYLKKGRHRRAKLQAVKMIKANDAGKGSLAVRNTLSTEGSNQLSEDIELITLSSDEN